MSSADLVFYRHLIATIWAGFAFVAGASIGSFLNVVAWRVPMGQSIVHPGSHCPRCNHPLAWYDNIPILGYLLLGARCRYCKAAISAQYPLVEALSGFLGLALWLVEGPGLGVFIDAAIVALLLALALIDARHFLLPLKMTIGLAVLALLRAPLVAFFDLHVPLKQVAESFLPGLYAAVLGAALLGGVAWLGTILARRSGRIGPDEDAMGGGDIILIAAIGARVGISAVLGVIFLASIQGALIGGIILWIQSLIEKNTEFRPEAEAAEEEDVQAAHAEASRALDEANLSGDDGHDDQAEEDEEAWEPPA